MGEKLTKENMVWHVLAGPKGGGQAYHCFDPVGDSLHIFRAKRVLNHAITHVEKISAFPEKSSDFPDYESGRARMGGGSCADIGYLYPLGEVTSANGHHWNSWRQAYYKEKIPSGV